MSASCIWDDHHCHITILHNDQDYWEEFDTFCSRTLFALILGVLRGVSGVVISFLRLKIVDQIGSVIHLVVWCCAAAFVTYVLGSVYK
jgi:hypothetical protein